MSLDKLKQTLAELGKNNIPTQTLWVRVTHVDWEVRTMTAVSINDELECFDIVLGLGSLDLKPKVGSTCLIGIIENSDTSYFLIAADEVEEIDMIANKCRLNINDGFLLQKQNESLAKLMSDLLKEIQKMKFTTNTGSTIKLVNQPQFLQIENRFKDFLKSN